jgi:dipeptidyl-peptidase 4
VTAPAPSFPRQHARTRRFTLGVPRGFEPGVGPHGPLVLFLRSDTGTDPVTHLWMHDPTDGTTRKLVDARELGDDGELPAEERARRERAREQAGGIVAYAVDAGFTLAALALAGRRNTVTHPDGGGVGPPPPPPPPPRPPPPHRTLSGMASLSTAQVEQILLEGYQRSTLRRSRPYHRHL